MAESACVLKSQQDQMMGYEKKRVVKGEAKVFGLSN